MRSVGIICEYNPFHAGHKRQFDILRSAGFDCIVCVMSGNYTQRGEAAIYDKYTRAASAVACGADLVLELPFPYSSFSAERFAAAGVHILNSIGGIDCISFGSETGDIESLLRIADTVSESEFEKEFFRRSKTEGSASAYFSLLGERGFDPEILSNDILAINYLKALLRTDSAISPYVIRRCGTAYASDKLTDPALPSSSALRALIKKDGVFSLPEDSIPEPAKEIYEKVGHTVITSKIDGIVTFFRLISADMIRQRAINICGGGSQIAEDGCGIVERLCNSALRSGGCAKEMIDAAKSKTFTDARLMRVALFSLFGVSDMMADTLPEYTLLLGADSVGCEFLAQARKNSKIPIITKPADIPLGVCRSVGELADSFYSSAMGLGEQGNVFMTKSPLISK